MDLLFKFFVKMIFFLKFQERRTLEKKVTTIFNIGLWVETPPPKRIYFEILKGRE